MRCWQRLCHGGSGGSPAVLPVIAVSSPPLGSALLPPILGEMVEPPVLLPILNIAGPAPRPAPR
jgi:hypothetical protein